MGNDKDYWMKDLDLNKGAFTRKAKRRGMSVAEFRNHVLANKDEYDGTTVKQANLARTFSKTRH
jgi:hypothetical protein